MYPRYRIVRNVRRQLTTIAAASRGTDGELNDAAGQLLEAVADDPAALASLRRAHPEFIDACHQHGWLADGRLQASFTTVDLEHPLTRLQIELTRHCNLRCAYCYSFSGPWQQGGLAIERVISHLQHAATLGCVTVDFTGGEPFLYPAWRDAVAEARRLGLVVTVHSNGTTCTRANLQCLADYGIKHLQVAFDSHLPEVHDRIRGLDGAFARSRKAVADARDLGLNVRVVLMVHRHNVDTIADSVSWFRHTLGVTVALDRVVLTGGELNARVGVGVEQYFNAVSPLLSRTFTETRICDSPGASGIEPHCGVAHSLAYITADGEVALCPTMTSRELTLPADEAEADQTLTAIWLDSPRFTALRGLNCENLSRCPTAAQCGGGCRSNAYADTNRLTAPDLLACNINKNRTTTFVNFYRLYENGQFELAGH